MTLKDWILVSISALNIFVTIIGLFLSYRSMKEEYRYSININNIKYKKEAYIKIMSLLDELYTDEVKFMQNDYYEKLRQTKYEIKLIGSKEVVKLFGEFMLFIGQLKENFDSFCEQCRIEFEGTTNLSGDEIEYNVNQEFELYLKNNNPKKDINSLMDNIYENMRNDIGVNGKEKKHLFKIYIKRH